MAGLSRRNNPDERETAYIEKELGKKPGNIQRTIISLLLPLRRESEVTIGKNKYKEAGKEEHQSRTCTSKETTAG